MKFVCSSKKCWQKLTLLLSLVIGILYFWFNWTINKNDHQLIVLQNASLRFFHEMVESSLLIVLLFSTIFFHLKLKRKNTSLEREIIERKEVEKVLQDREFFFRESQRAASIGSYKTDFISGFWQSSEVLDQIFGIDKAYVRSVQKWLEIIHPEDQEMMNRYLKEEVIVQQKAFNKEYRIIRKSDQQTRWVLGLGEVDFDQNARIISMIGTIQDITERKLSEEKLQQFNRALTQSGEIIFITNKDGIITFINPEFTKVYGYSAEEVIGRVTPRVLKSDLLNYEDYTHFWETLQARRSTSAEYLNKRKDGSLINVEGSADPILDKKGEIIGFLGIQRDITQRKQNEKELIQAKEKAEESQRLISAFLANMGHEIRTPMNGIMGFAELLKEPHLSGKDRQEYIRIIEQSGDRMLNIINQLIDISKIESHCMEVYFNETNINELIDYIYHFFKPEIEAKGMKFFIQNRLIPAEVILKTDAEKLYAILINLVKNAVKFSDKGTIELKLERKDELMEFVVKDEGIGIPLDKRENVFGRFVQVETGHKRKYQGAGLGLSIAKAYVEMLNGRIWLNSEEGKGCEFHFTIPVNG